ncbi:enoyl-ACP reductase FabI [Marinibactrum halimedae]|uniref:Enoyl-[acyl-carrier-protein] reductase [NADH] n=1 Tax=Marinibactrum halimedae TaxID=1444977 RepID=A0AA37WKG9_9GAMM|nr:enoyl-ACP reductase FabI [Marinibactrum halimedae]MCD9457648.1 enoyl-ACP reductase FabI [Marinibactrum halimedae]GLS24978.1 enoyl-[acyl-carrier-protein] reductase [NADH] [Marinibactrum halimedae]
MNNLPAFNLNGKRGLVVGIANEQSIAWGCARYFAQAGAELAITYLNDKAEVHVRPLADAVNARFLLPLNVDDDEQMNALFDTLQVEWGRIDFILHSIAFAPSQDLHGRVVDCSRQGFLSAMDISCHSLFRLVKRAEPLMTQGGSIITVSYYGAEKVVDHYSLMGPVKAALECSVRYLAAELGASKIRVNALSPGPLLTRAASGIEHFDELLSEHLKKSPLKRPLDLNDVGAFAQFLVSDAAKNITGSVHYIDGGYEIMD